LAERIRRTGARQNERAVERERNRESSGVAGEAGGTSFEDGCLLGAGERPVLTGCQLQERGAVLGPSGGNDVATEATVGGVDGLDEFGGALLVVVGETACLLDGRQCPAMDFVADETPVVEVVGVAGAGDERRTRGGLGAGLVAGVAGDHLKAIASGFEGVEFGFDLGEAGEVVAFEVGVTGSFDEAFGFGDEGGVAGLDCGEGVHRKVLLWSESRARAVEAARECVRCSVRTP
jgi:hypothetical protein